MFTGNFSGSTDLFGSTQVVEMLTGEYIEFSAFGCGVFALSLIFASYASQTLTWCDPSYPKGQWESGAALGLSRPYTFIHLIMPQVWRHALPGLSNQWLVLLKRYGVGVVNWCR